MEKIEIGFQAGEGRDIHGGVNYMINNDYDLYAEIAVPDEPVDEEYGYFALKEAIIKQAAEKGIEKERLAFWYDGQEQYLSKAANVG